MRSVYIVFSATPYKMGRLIRTILRNEYNHVSLAFDEELSTMCSFARFHENAPLYGGFVAESLRRHVPEGRSSRIRVCRLMLSEAHYGQLQSFVSSMRKSRGRYIYNTYSAIVSPLHIRLSIPDSFTCAEFVGDCLSIAGLEIRQGGFHSLSRLEQLLEPYTIYEGSCASYADAPDWGEDHFPEHMGRISAATATLRAFSRLTYRAVLGMFTAFLCNLG